MIEIILLDYLEGALKIPVTPEYPEDPPERFVVLRFGDTTRENLLETTVVIAESHEGSLLKAAQLNRQVKAAMDALTELPEISAARLASDYPAPDTKNKRYRYQAVYNITHY